MELGKGIKKIYDEFHRLKKEHSKQALKLISKAGIKENGRFMNYLSDFCYDIIDSDIFMDFKIVLADYNFIEILFDEKFKRDEQKNQSNQPLNMINVYELVSNKKENWPRLQNVLNEIAGPDALDLKIIHPEEILNNLKETIYEKVDPSSNSEGIQSSSSNIDVTISGLNTIFKNGSIKVDSSNVHHNERATENLVGDDAFTPLKKLTVHVLNFGLLPIVDRHEITTSCTLKIRIDAKILTSKPVGLEFSLKREGNENYKEKTLKTKTLLIGKNTKGNGGKDESAKEIYVGKKPLRELTFKLDEFIITMFEGKKRVDDRIYLVNSRYSLCCSAFDVLKKKTKYLNNERIVRFEINTAANKND